MVRSGLPDGARRADYAYLADLDRAGMMWEWLRRDPHYAAWYIKASTATCGPSPGVQRWRLLFPENPVRAAPAANILWCAELDPGTLRVIAIPTTSRDPEGLPVGLMKRWITVVRGDADREHVVVSDGLRRIRLDVEHGTLSAGPVVLHYLLHGTRRAGPKLMTLRRLMALCLDRRFPSALFPRDPRADRWVQMLRVHDAERVGASHREVAEILFGVERVGAEWSGPSDALRSRVRRLIGEARQLAAGGYRWLLRG